MGSARAVVVAMSLSACGADPGGADEFPDAAPIWELDVNWSEYGHLFAIKNGDAPWRSIGRNERRIVLTSDRYGIAIGCEIAPSHYRVEIAYVTLAEAKYQLATCLQTSAGTLVRGVVTGIRPKHVATVTSEIAEAQVANSGRFALEIPPSTGANLIVVERAGTDVTRVAWTYEYPSNGELPPIDLDAIGKEVTTYPITLTGTVRPPVRVRTIVRGFRGEAEVLLDESESVWYAIAQGADRAGISQVTATSQTFDHLLESTMFGPDRPDLTLHLPDWISSPELGVGAIAPYVRLRIKAPLDRDADVHGLTLIQAEGSETRTWSISFSKGYVGGARDVTTIMPDFSELAAFDGRAGFVWGSQVAWRWAFAVSNGGYTASRLDCTVFECRDSVRMADGTTLEVSSAFGTFVP